jgi:sugar phosphate permease
VRLDGDLRAVLDRCESARALLAPNLTQAVALVASPLALCRGRVYRRRMVRFIVDNVRWLAAGLLLTFASSFGQTWFISLFAGEIKAAYGLSDGAWGSLYTLATFCSAALLLAAGSTADTVRLARLAPAMALLFAAAGFGLASSQSLVTMVVALFLLRFCGQGMFSHIAMTAMGRWFRARRGQAVSIANLGHPGGEMVLPVATVLVVAAIGWQATWVVVALILALAVAPVLYLLLSSSREPQGAAAGGGTAGLGGRHWTRGEVIGHWLFPALLPIVLTPGFIGTVVFFHQVHVAEVKGWTLAQMAPGYSVFATLTVASALATGWASDRFGPHRVLPVLLAPTAIGVALIGPAEAVWGWFAALGFIGLTQGMSSALWGALLPSVWGTRHLGAVRSMVTTAMVVSTAIGPGVTGVLIDLGVDFPQQTLALAGWCFALCGLGFLIQRRITAEAAELPA